ncbi:MAG: VCBS repeat-containing protein [Lewinellaceae bacterium]|nr:VCBS repeat-containing protein [Saprospiraceae bacterium]MCB9314485.1 VCBS repeat-containing protein [Lewinellaceae bacterium]
MCTSIPTKLPLLFLILGLVIPACTGDHSGTSGDVVHEVEPTLEARNPVMKLLTSEETGIAFQNQIIETYENNITTNINMYNGGGLAIADINNDGLPDIYFIGSNGPNGMYLNKGGLTFEDITASSGLASEEGFETAVTVVDINTDGYLDFYICRAGVEKNDFRRNKLYINNGDLTFTEKAAEYGLDDKSASTGANFFDYDQDGDLDVYILNYPTESIWTNKIEAKLGDDGKYRPVLFPRAEFDTDRFYRNDGGSFTDVSKESGIWNLAYGLSVSVSDFNQDGWLDIYVGNDFIQPDILYINNKNGTFTDQIDKYFRHSTQHTMGTDLTDFDNDGWVDLFAVDMLSANNKRQKEFFATNTQSKYTSLVQNGYFPPVVRNVLQRNNGNGTFSDIGCLAQVYKTDWSWSGLLFDMDNNGFRDLHITNGYRREVTNRDFIDFTLPETTKAAGSKKRLRDIYPNFQEFLDIIPTFKLRNFAYQNNGNWQFNDVTGQWMTIPASWSCGAVWSDLDADGDLDMVINNLEDPAFVYENLSSGKEDAKYLQVVFKGPKENPAGVGASAAIYYGNDEKQYAENVPTRGIFSSVEHLIHFGLGKHDQVDRLIVRWPDGKTQEWKNLPANQRLIVQHKDATGHSNSIAPTSVPRQMYHGSTLSGYAHQENEFNDFEVYPLIPWTESDQSPLMAVGDVNNDGLDDFFIGNSFDQSPALMIQKPNGSFTQATPSFWEQENVYEDHGAVFFDADRDGDLDLYVISGGWEAKKDIAKLAWENRLYINLDGKGTFTRARGVIPELPSVAQRVAPFDYDEDGDLDLFVGGRLTPDNWPLTPGSVILRNDNDHFTDVTSSVGPDFAKCGMVTDLQWANLDQDPGLELVVVGEWMPVTVFKMKDGKLVNHSKGTIPPDRHGLWYRLAIADLDQDGDLDLVTGNLGLNTRLTASPEGPLRCFAADFDKNNTLDPIMAYYEDGQLYPLVQKEVLHKHMPVLKKRLLKAKDYSVATIDKVWPQSDLDASLNLFAHTLETCWWENQNGKFIQRKLPIQAQVAPVQGIIATDLNGDGHTDLFLAGNRYGMEVETNPCNASNGIFLAGDGAGGFTWVDNTRTGIWTPGEVRDLALLRGPQGKPVILASNKNGPIQIFK